MNATEIRVWDPFIRNAHWVVAVGFFLNCFTGQRFLVDNPARLYEFT